MDKLLELQRELAQQSTDNPIQHNENRTCRRLRIIVDELVQQRQTIKENGPAKHRD